MKTTQPVPSLTLTFTHPTVVFIKNGCTFWMQVLCMHIHFAMEIVNVPYYKVYMYNSVFVMLELNMAQMTTMAWLNMLTRHVIVCTLRCVHTSRYMYTQYVCRYMYMYMYIMHVSMGIWWELSVNNVQLASIWWFILLLLMHVCPGLWISFGVYIRPPKICLAISCTYGEIPFGTSDLSGRYTDF